MVLHLVGFNASCLIAPFTLQYKPPLSPMLIELGTIRHTSNGIMRIVFFKSDFTAPAHHGTVAQISFDVQLKHNLSETFYKID